MKNIYNVENKIEELVEYICAKPVNKITHDDYEILKSERSEFRSRNGSGVYEVKIPEPRH